MADDSRRRTSSGQRSMDDRPAEEKEETPVLPPVLRQPPPAPSPASQDCLGCKIVGSGTLFAVSLYTWSQGASLPPRHANKRFLFLFSAAFACGGIVRAAM